MSPSHGDVLSRAAIGLPENPNFTTRLLDASMLVNTPSPGVFAATASAIGGE